MLTLPGYTLRDLLRETPPSSVFRACRDADQASVVLKILVRDSSRPEHIARLKHEYRILSAIHSPYIVRTYGWVDSGQTIALVLEDAGSRPAVQLVQPGGMDVKVFLELAIALAQAVDAVHRHHVVHKDIKPHHFLLDAVTGQPKLIDFRIATDLPRQVQQLVSVQQLEGTLAYISPEQTGRVDRVLDHRTDLYSLGVSFYELLTGSLPFCSADPLELIHSHVARAPQHPRELRPKLPDVLCAMVLKLLSKVAEERYHTAAGLVADLQTCLDALDGQGRLPEFVPGQRDISEELCVARKLYGREAEVQTLRAALDRVRLGATELWWVRGPSGIGKSALVHEIQQLVLVSGRFATGKFDHVDRSTPYGTVASACRSLVRSVLGEGAERLGSWRQRFLDAVGPNGQLVIGLVPELELVMGPQPAVQQLDASEAQHRFELVLHNFLRVFASEEHPLVLFLDDLQWADPASLRWLQRLLTGPNRGYLLVLGAYRDQEVDATHPLSAALRDLAEAGVVAGALELQPLDLPQVARLLADTLACSSDRAEPLAELMRAKTGGNPFFLDQLLGELYRAGLVWFDGRHRTWTWDLHRVEQVAVTDNVADLMVTQLARLPEATQRVLRLAACMVHQFDGQALAVIAELTPAQVASLLDPALREGLLLPLDAENHNWVRTGTSSEPLLGTLTASYRFLHDRVQQATYESIDPCTRSPVHLSIGRLMLARDEGHPTDDHLFAVVDHLNQGASGIEHIEEKRMLARLNLRAGRKARDEAAHTTASKLLGTALGLLGDDAWFTDREISHAAHITKAECEFLTGHPDLAFALLDAVEDRAHNALERVPARELRTTMLTTMNRLPEAVALALDTTRLLGADFPRAKEEVARALGEAFAELQTALAGRDIESLIDLPAMKDPDKLALVNILFRAGPAVFQFDPDLTVLAVVKVIKLALQYGNAAVLPYFYESYGVIHPVLTEDYETAYRFGRLGVELCARYGTPPVGGATHFVFAAFISHWRRSHADSIEHLRLGLKASLEAGDHVHAGYCICLAVFHRFFRGENLEGLLGDFKGVSEQLERTDDIINLRQLSILAQLCRSLIGVTRSPGSLDGEGFDEEAFRRSFQGNRSLHVYYYVLKTVALYYADEFADAIAASEQAIPLQPGLYLVVEHCLYRALALAAQCRSAEPTQRETLLEALRAEEAKLRAWARFEASHNEYRHALVAAELASVEDAFDRASDLYDQAIALARADGALHLMALGSELCGELYFRRGRTRIARAYLSDAYRAYLAWGALVRANRLVARHADLQMAPSHDVPVSGSNGEQPRAAFLDSVSTNAGDSAVDDGQFDWMAAVRATQAIASELDLESVLDRLLRVLLGHAGAQKIYLVLVRDETLAVEACAMIDPDQVRLGIGERVSTSSRLASSVVQYVARSLETVVVTNAVIDPLFARDPYVVAARPKSLLCLPMQHRGHLVGVLYFENNAATHVFGRTRLELLEFLAAQAAIAVENAKLYGDLQTASELLRRNNEALEAQVAQRTEQLSRALADLWSEMDLARKIQTVLLPNARQVGSCEIAATMIPASSVGGDYYDTFQCGDSGWVLIGDVSGHGISAGLSMMMVQTAVRAIVGAAAGCPGRITPAQVLARVNSVVSANLAKVSRGQYMTLTALEIRGATVTHAGLHMDLLHYHANSGQVERIPTDGMWVGVVDDISPLVRDASFDLDDGDVLLLFTDGITESMVGDRRLGTDGLAALLSQFAGQSSSPESIVKGINRYMAGCGAHDDMTVVAIRYAASAEGVACGRN